MEEKQYSEFCPYCDLYTLVEQYGIVWMEDGKLRISYMAKCDSCQKVINYEGTVYDY